MTPLLAALRWFASDWLRIPAVLGPVAALALFGLWQWARADLDACNAGRALDRATYARAQAEATAKHTQQARAKEAEYAKLQQESDNALDTARADSQRRLAQWMRDNPSAVRPSGRSDLPRAAETAQVVDGPAACPAPVVTSDDLKAWDEAYTRLANAREWALKQESAR